MCDIGTITLDTSKPVSPTVSLVLKYAQDQGLITGGSVVDGEMSVELDPALSLSDVLDYAAAMLDQSEIAAAFQVVANRLQGAMIAIAAARQLEGVSPTASAQLRIAEDRIMAAADAYRQCAARVAFPAFVG